MINAFNTHQSGGAITVDGNANMSQFFALMFFNLTNSFIILHHLLIINLIIIKKLSLAFKTNLHDLVLQKNSIFFIE